ncbi:MAG TPA: hypothetical protein VFJ43_14580 [Bacteroidia bacterium]|nr:hypothetical protein [Bacteroidia bacterium]
MENLSSQEFIDQLKTNSFKQNSVLKGIVKKSDNDSEILFARKGDFGNWVKIPASMIESVNVIKTFSKGEETFTIVKLHLKTPTTPEAKVLHELLSSHEHEGMCPACGKHFWMSRFFGHHHGCNCHNHHENFFGKCGKFFGHHHECEGHHE